MTFTRRRERAAELSLDFETGSVACPPGHLDCKAMLLVLKGTLLRMRLT